MLFVMVNPIEAAAALDTLTAGDSPSDLEASTAVQLIVEGVAQHMPAAVKITGLR